MNIARIMNGEVGNYLYFYVTSASNAVIALSYFERTKSAVQAMGAWIKQQGKRSGGTLRTSFAGEGERNYPLARYLMIPSKSEYEVYSTSFTFAKDRANISFVYNKEINERYLLTTEEWFEEDIYNVLMNQFSLPLLREWMPYFIDRLAKAGYYNVSGRVFGVDGAQIPFWRDGMKEPVQIALGDLKVVELNVTEVQVENILSAGLKSGEISFADEKQLPLCLGEQNQKTGSWSLDTYMEHYGAYLNKNVEKVVRPLVPLMDKVEGFAAKSKRIYPQQAAVINGLIALADNGEKYGYANCGPGCGKTIMAIGMVEGRENQKWLKHHPGKSLKDMYLSSDQPKYRVVVMPPSHMVEKWKREIEDEVPGAKVVILDKLSQLVELRQKGKQPAGREWYIVSKDFAKLDGETSPIPTVVGSGMAEVLYCSTCRDKGVKSMVRKDDRGRGICPTCYEGNPKNFHYEPVEEWGIQRGLMCPHCGKLLVAPNVKRDDDETRAVLRPSDFAAKTNNNRFCTNCGTSLWGYNCKNIGGTAKKPLWSKVSYYKSWNKKGRGTAWVLRHHESEFYLSEGLLDGDGRLHKDRDVKESPRQVSARKVAPSTFIKKYLKGFWDYVVLDEVHKYEGAGTAQMQAAHALVKTGRFTLGLTGTITNGKADSLYYLLWMMEPNKMVEKGYKFGSSGEFSRQYGCIEAVYEAATDYSGGYGKMSKGRLIKNPRTKPGINPLVYSEFLLGHAINMDLSDLSKFLPPLKEYVEVLDLPEDVRKAYSHSANVFKEVMRKSDGACLQGEGLNFCLSYPDKPYGREPVLHPKYKDTLVLNPPNCDKYRNELLPKEKRIVEIVKQEIAEDRNVFIFANFTGKEESNITPRLQEIIEKECCLAGRVMVLKADTPQAVKREAYIHAQAKAGVKVVITNAKVCETGLDFCWEENGVFYNYPTIIFAQPTYELTTMIQASRRHYRLCQKLECRTYWMVYANTLQAAALEIMASKQVAAAAIQGKFSAEGLASMARGVDSRVLLAQKLSDGDNSSREELSSMFDVLAKNNAGDDDDGCSSYTPHPLFFEIMGEDYVEEILEKELPDFDDILFGSESMRITPVVPVKPVIPEPEVVVTKTEIKTSADLWSLFNEDLIVNSVVEPVVVKKSVRKKSFAVPQGQFSFFD